LALNPPALDNCQALRWANGYRQVDRIIGYGRAFVPKGQADSSQARSAWLAMQRGSRPGGTVEANVSPEWVPYQARASYAE